MKNLNIRPTSPVLPNVNSPAATVYTHSLSHFQHDRQTADVFTLEHIVVQCTTTKGKKVATTCPHFTPFALEMYQQLSRDLGSSFGRLPSSLSSWLKFNKIKCYMSKKFYKTEMYRNKACK